MTTQLSLNGKPTFGAGRVFAIGNYTDPTPARALVPQSQGVDFKRKTESLFGENQLPVAVGAGQMDVTGKVEYSASQARLLGDMVFGVTGTTGQYAEADREAGTVAATTPYIITVANASHFEIDLGVVNPATGVIYACVAHGSEVAGASYSVNTSTGVYTFASGDEGLNLQISYAYAITAAGETLTLTNQPQGLTGNFQAVHVLPWGTTQDMYVFFSCIASSAGFSGKNSGFAQQTFEYSAFTNDNDELGVATFAQAA